MFPNLISYQKLIKYKKDITPSVRKVQALKQEEYPLYIKEFYEKRTHHCLDLEEPKRLTEKIHTKYRQGNYFRQCSHNNHRLTRSTKTERKSVLSVSSSRQARS